VFGTFFGYCQVADDIPKYGIIHMNNNMYSGYLFLDFFLTTALKHKQTKTDKKIREEHGIDKLTLMYGIA